MISLTFFHRCRRLIPALLLSLCGAGCSMIPPPRALVNMATPAPKPGEDRTKFNLSVYDNVWHWVDARYYDEHFNGADWPGARERHRAAAAAAKNDRELYQAINAMLAELNDRHTAAQPAPDFASTFRGIYVVLGLRSQEIAGAQDGRRRVIEVFPKSSAAEVGVQVGWTLLACDGRPPLDVIGGGRLREGQKVRCDFLTEQGENVTRIVMARRMTVPTFRNVREAAPGIYVLRFDRFDMGSAKWVRQQVKAHAAAKGLIFDLRGNPGGHVFALTSILADVFSGSVDVGEFVHRGEVAHWHQLVFQHGGAHYGGKIAVLVSRNTTSAAEIFSQLVQEHGRGPVIGQQTGGALLVTVFWPLAGGGKLWLSVYDYHSPKGARVELKGVTPDIAVPDAGLRGLWNENDPVVQTAVEALQR